MDSFFASADMASRALPLHATTSAGLERFLSARTTNEARWLRATGFRGAENELAMLPATGGALAGAVMGLGAGRDPLALALFSERLPAGDYVLGDVPESFGGARAALAWILGAYTFDRYRKPSKRERPRLILPEGVNGEAIERAGRAVFLARDLINTPANDMGPGNLEHAARNVATVHDAQIRVITGEALLQENYPLIHAVGQASPREPRLIDITWGDPRAPKVTLVGKGVCFDTGGLDLKPSSGMLTMKKDMGGAACMLALGCAVMEAKLKLRLRVMIPAVENSVSGNAFRPGDVYPSRKGLTVEIGNTDAEGRLVLADALADADTENPELLLCMATLTGAARSATGMELPPFFTDDERLAADLMRHGTAEHDPLWRLPLWRSYEPTVDSTIADVNNAPEYGLAGAITAALFLNRFVTSPGFAHFDIPAWTDRPKPGRRKGAEASAVRALLALLSERYPAEPARK